MADRAIGKHTVHFAICRHRRFTLVPERSANRPSRFKQACLRSAASQRKTSEMIRHGVVFKFSLCAMADGADLDFGNLHAFKIAERGSGMNSRDPFNRLSRVS